MSFVYKIYREGQLIYVGISENLKQRMSSHKQDQWYAAHDKCVYAEFPNRTVAELYETYLINKYEPTYNIAKQNHDSVDWVHFHEEIIVWKKWPPKQQQSNPPKQKDSSTSKKLTRSEKNKLLRQQRLEKIKVQNQSTLNWIKQNLDKISAVYYDKYRHLCVEFKGTGTHSQDEDFSYRTGGANVCSGWSFNDEELTLHFFDNGYGESSEVGYDEWKSAVDKIHDLIDIKSHNINILDGVIANQKRIDGIRKQFDKAINMQCPVHLNSTLKKAKGTINFDELKRIKRFQNEGDGFYDITFSRSIRRVFYDSPMLKSYQKTNDLELNEEFKRDVMWYKKKGDLNAMMFASDIDREYLLYFLATNQIEILIGYNEKESDSVILPVNHLQFDGLGWELTVEEVESWLEKHVK